MNDGRDTESWLLPTKNWRKYMPHMEKSLNMPLHQVLKIMQNRIMKQSKYHGVKAVKSPLDFWIYQEIIFETKPDFIIEVGNLNGGGTLALAHTCDNLRHGKIIGLDVKHSRVPQFIKDHGRITFITGDACSNFGKVRKLIPKGSNVLVIEDSSHTYQNTLKVLQTYSVLLKPGNYFIVEDGICHHGLEVGPKPGPYEAIGTFIKNNPKFVIDRSKESFLITWNPKGYLKRVK